MLDDLKLGPIQGYSALIIILAAVLAAAALIAVLVINIIKAVKEHRDELEDKAEDEFFAEYGVTGEELRLNQKLAIMRAKLKGKKISVEKTIRKAQHVVVEEPITVADQAPAEPVVEEPTPVEEPVAPVEEPVVEPVKEEPIAEPVKEEPVLVEEPAPVVEPAPVAEPEPIVEPVVEPEPEKKGVAKPATKKVVKKKPDDWSKYDGTYEGYYYDPEDACYYEGTPSAALAKKLAAKEAELEALNANKDKKVVIKKVAPPFAALKTPKNVRQEPKKVDGFDEAVIYGKYIIEHVDKEDGTQEWFYTLYDASGKNIYESSNYTTKEYCERAINRFKSHAIIGAYTIEAADGKFFFVLKRKTYVHKGSPQATFEQANEHMKQIKSFAQTDIVRVQ